MEHPITPPPEPLNTARCLGTGTYEGRKFYWREGCDECQRRYVKPGEKWAGDWIDPPPIIAFECEYRIGPDEIVAQGEHAPGPKPLSPAAQAVLDAVSDEYRTFVFIEYDDENPFAVKNPVSKIAAAAIRALADQVTPSDAVEPRNNLPMAMECQRIRADILAIATELEAPL